MIIRSEMPASSRGMHVDCELCMKACGSQGVKLNGAFKSNFLRLRRAGTPPLVIGVGLEVFATPLENCGNSSPPPLENREGSLSRVKIARALPLQAPSNGVPNFGGVLLTVEEMFRVRGVSARRQRPCRRCLFRDLGDARWQHDDSR